MYKNFKVSLSLFTFKIFFSFFKLFPMKEKSTFVTAFGPNVHHIVNEVELQTDEEIVILKTDKNMHHFNANDRIIIPFNRHQLIQHIRGIYHLATSRFVFVDNDFLFLAATHFKEDVKCVQLWHTTGTVKKFGLGRRKLPQYKKVYERFDHIVVGSSRMTKLYNESFGTIKKDTFIKTGVPRTDFLFNELAQKQTQLRLESEFPIIREKEVILYAPTYREYDLNHDKFEKSLEKLYNEFKYDFVLFLRLHPNDDMTYENKFPGFIYNVTSYPNLNELAVASDILITDYSSIPFEFALLNKPIIFYAFDIDEYKESRGFIVDYRKFVPGPIVTNTKDLIKTIKARDYDVDIVEQFGKDWNEYSYGQSSYNLVKFLYNVED